MYSYQLAATEPGPHIITSITVSPESNLKNATKSNSIHNIHKSSKLNNDKTANNLTKSINLADRNRRLIPYMTFYIPTEDDNFDAIQQQYNSPSQLNQPNQHPDQKHQSNQELYQQNEPQTLQVKITPTEILNPEAFIQRHRHHHAHPQQQQQTYLTDEHLSKEPVYIQMRLHPSRAHHHPNNGFQQSSIVYENLRQQGPLNPLPSKGIVNQPQIQQHHQLLYQHQPQPQHQLQETNIEDHLPTSENIAKYHLYQSHRNVNYQSTQEQPQKFAISENPIVLHQEQQQQQPIQGKLYSSPFTPFNKIPGEFTPILYVNDAIAKSVNYHEKSPPPPQSPSSTPPPTSTSMATTLSSLTHNQDENDSSIINDDSQNVNDIPVKQVLNENIQSDEEYLKQNFQLYKLKSLKEQIHNYQSHQLQHSQPQQHQHQIYKYPVGYSQHSDDVREQQEISSLSHHHHNHVNTNNPDSNNYNNVQSTSNESDEHIVALVPLQKLLHSHNQRIEEKQLPIQNEPNHVNHVKNIISTTQRPTYKLVSQSQKQQTQSTQMPITISTPEPELTPQERYVAYLQQQLRQKYKSRSKDNQSKVQSHHKEQVDPYLISASPSPNPPENYLYAENQKPLPQYPKYIYPIRSESENINNDKNLVYSRPQELPQNPRSQIQSHENYLQLGEIQTSANNHNQRPQTQGNQHFVPVVSQLIPSSTPQTILIPVQQKLPLHLHSQLQPPQKDINKLRPLFFVTTARPVVVTAVGSIYKYEPIQRLHPINLIKNHEPSTSTMSPSLKISLPTTTTTNSSSSSSSSAHSNTLSIQVGQKNHYNVQPTLYYSNEPPSFVVKPPYLTKTEYAEKPSQEQQMRQHLTETSKVPSSSHLHHLNSFKSYSQLGHYQKSHPNNYYEQQNIKSNKIPYRQYYPSQINQDLKLKPLQNNLNQNYESSEKTQPTSTPLYSASATSSTEREPTIYHQSAQSNYEEDKSSEEQQVIQHRPKIISQKLPNFKDSASLSEILRKLQETNHLPQTITPDNIDNSIKTLIKILNNLKESQTIVENPPQHHEQDYNDYEDTPVENADPSKPGPNSGRPGIDYPNLAEIPHTKFNCKEQRYKGFFGDPETNCQVWHYCDLNGGQASFLCPNGTIFSQIALTCDWWFNVKCSTTPQLYVLNERLYKYILPFTPKFPEDYSGPLVDKYLALKFKEMEEKMQREKENESKEEDEDDENSSKSYIMEDDKLADEHNSESINSDSNQELNRDTHRPEEKAHEQTHPLHESNSEDVKSVNLVDVEENRGAVDTGITHNTYTTLSSITTTPSIISPSPPSPSPPPPLTVKPIYVSSTTSPAPIYSSTYIDSSSSTSAAAAPFSTAASTIMELKSNHQNQLRLRQRYKLNRNRIGNRKPKVDVESEKVEVIEIKTDGSSGHIIPNIQQHTEYTYSK